MQSKSLTNFLKVLASEDKDGRVNGSRYASSASLDYKVVVFIEILAIFIDLKTRHDAKKTAYITVLLTRSKHICELIL